MRWLLSLLLLVVPVIASASNSSLDEARKAVDEIRYDDARTLLVQALKQGGNRPEQLVEIYRLSAATAVVLGSSDLAEQYYRRMLALDPNASLPADASPRLREPFVAAQAYMAAQQRFDVRATRTEKGITVSIIDPLGMVVAVATLEQGVMHGKAGLIEAGMPGAFGANLEPLVLEDVGDELVLLDEHGNFLRIVDLPARPKADDVEQAHTPILRRWITWAIPAGGFAGATTYFFIDGARAHDRLDTLLAASGGHYFDEAEQERTRWRRDTIIGWVGVGVTLGLTTAAIVMARSRPRAVTVAPSVGSDHASVQLEAKF
jgi:hypothetical protein